MGAPAPFQTNMPKPKVTSICVFLLEASITEQKCNTNLFGTLNTIPTAIGYQAKRSVTGVVLVPCYFDAELLTEIAAQEKARRIFELANPNCLNVEFTKTECLDSLDARQFDEQLLAALDLIPRAEHEKILAETRRGLQTAKNHIKFTKGAKK